MSIRDIGPWLLENPDFRARMERLSLRSVRRQFPGSVSLGPPQKDDHEVDWPYLLLAASFLAESAAAACQDAALRIAQTCLEDNVVSSRRDAAAFVLDKLANRPAITLAEKRHLLEPNIRSRLPLPLRLQWSRHEAEQTDILVDERVYLNHFQRDFLSALKISSRVSASAPTAAGKSFLLLGWMIDYVRENPGSTVVYLVPTRALISEVELKFRAKTLRYENEINISSLPASSAIKASKANILVLTQERLQLLLASTSIPAISVVVVDEAHKIGDGHRGVLLQQVLEMVERRYPAVRLVYSSPLTSNPEIFLTDLGHDLLGIPVRSNDVTVNQNIIWVEQRPYYPQEWHAKLLVDGEPRTLGSFRLPFKPTSNRKRVAFVAHALAGNTGGNLVYANGAADAEKCADLIGQLLGSSPKESRDELDEFALLVKKVVHPKYALAEVAKRGAAFHYGNMPLILRSEIERLFTSNTIKYLVCTSTLVEGVNLSCRNIFLRGPKKGMKSRMSLDDFWNLAGRAGRWGSEFQGNVICIDPAQAKLWGDDGAPRGRKLVTIRRATDEAIRNPKDLLEFIYQGTPRSLALSRPDLESVTSYLVSEHLQLGSIALAGWARRLPAEAIQEIGKALESRFGQLTIPLDVVQRNPGISPLALEALLAYFNESDNPLEELLIPDPNSEDAVQGFTRVFQRIQGTLGGSIAPTSGIAFWRALLVTQWMQGFPLARLVDARIRREGNGARGLSATIRAVLEDVEKVARFEAPKLLGAYRDILGLHLAKQGRMDLLEGAPDVTLYLEFGASQMTQISLMSLGLSRSSAIELAELIAEDNLDQEAVLKWLRGYSAESSDLPEAMVREIASVLAGPRQ